MREAGRLGQMAHDETGFGYPEHKRLKNEFGAQGVWDSIKDIPTCGVLRRDDAKKIIEDVVAAEGRCRIVGWREVPVDGSVVGRMAKRTQPRFMQAGPCLMTASGPV